MNGNAVMFDTGKILAFGGANDFSGGRDPAKSDVSLITLSINGEGENTASAVRLPSLAYSRVYHNSVVLPSGHVVVIGGASRPQQYRDTYSRMIPGMVIVYAHSGFVMINPFHDIKEMMEGCCIPECWWSDDN